MTKETSDKGSDYHNAFSKTRVPADKPLGISILISIITFFIILWMGYSIRIWENRTQEETILISSKMLLNVVKNIDTDIDSNVEAINKILSDYQLANPSVKNILILEGTQFVANTDKDLVSTRLKRDDISHKALYDDSKTLQENFSRNIEERKKFPELKSNPFQQILITHSESEINLRLPIIENGELQSLLAIKTQSNKIPTPLTSGIEMGIIAAIPLLLCFITIRKKPKISIIASGILFFILSLVVIERHNATLNSLYQQEIIKSVDNAAFFWQNQVKAHNIKTTYNDLINSINQDNNANTVDYVNAIPPTDNVLNKASLGRATTYQDNIIWNILEISFLIFTAYSYLVFRGKNKELAKDIANHSYAYLYVAPAVFGLAVLVFAPFIFGIALGFYSRSYNTYTFVGLQNFIDILWDLDFKVANNFYRTFAITILWTVVNVFLHVSIGLGLALILKDQNLKFTAIYRTLLIIPWAVPNYITALIWKGMFNKEYGAVNTFLYLFHIEPISWFNTFWGAFTANLATNVWLGFPFMMVISLGALQSIPSELYEAAEVDGANKWSQFRWITLPLLKPALFPAIILGIIWTFNQFNVIYLVSNGAPYGETDILVTEAYRWAFERQQYGYASAYSMIIFAILFSYTYITNKITKSTESAY